MNLYPWEWKNYIARNFPVIWMSGLHLIAPMCILFAVAGIYAGLNYPLSWIKSNLLSANLITASCLVLLAISWQYLRFKKHLTRNQLFRLYIINILTYSFLIVSCCTPYIAFERKMSAENVRSKIFEDLQVYQQYIYEEAFDIDYRGKFYSQPDSLTSIASRLPGLFGNDWYIIMGDSNGSIEYLRSEGDRPLEIVALGKLKDNAEEIARKYFFPTRRSLFRGWYVYDKYNDLSKS